MEHLPTSDQTKTNSVYGVNCPVCFSTNIELIQVGYPFFRHLDFEAMYQSGGIGRCNVCQTLFNTGSRDRVDEIVKMYRSFAYYQSGQTRQTLNVGDFKQPVSRSFLQAELLCERLHTGKPAILDIGCFNGELLIEFDRRFPSAELYGIEVNEHLHSVFPRKDNFHFWSSDPEGMDGVFDLICMSHSIMYISDIPSLVERIKRWMKPEGLLFIQTPDILKNPGYLLMGDQYYYYTVTIMQNSLQHFGFEYSVVGSNWFPREVVGLAKLGSREAQVTYVEDLAIHQCMKDLDAMARKVKGIPSARRVGVLGTTVNAAFVDSIRGETVGFFVDERDNRRGSKFRGKEVLHPRSLSDSDLLIIPYGESNERIRKRFEREYKCRLTCV